MQRRSGFVWRKSSVTTPTSAGTSSARSHTSLWPITLAESTTRYRGWWRRTRCVGKDLELCSESWPQIPPLIFCWILCFRTRCHQSSSTCFRSLTTPCFTRSSLTRKLRTQPLRGSVKSLWSPSSRWEPTKAYISLSRPVEFLLGGLSRSTEISMFGCRTLWRAWWGSSTPQHLTTLAASNQTQTASHWPSERRR